VGGRREVGREGGRGGGREKFWGRKKTEKN